MKNNLMCKKIKPNQMHYLSCLCFDHEMSRRHWCYCVCRSPVDIKFHALSLKTGIVITFLNLPSVKFEISHFFLPCNAEKSISNEQ